MKNDTSRISSLRENGILNTDTRDKAYIYNIQFQLAFTRETDSDLPSKGESPFSAMEDMTVDTNGVTNLL